MRIVELIMDELDENSGIEAISIVESPAIEENFLALSEKKEYKFAEIDKEKQILMGAILVPNKPIYRKDGDEEYYIYFTKDTVRKASELFLAKGNQNQTTYEHFEKIEGLSLVESWIVEDKEKEFSIEGFFADKAERPKDKSKDNLSKEIEAGKTLLKIKKTLMENEIL